MGKSDLRIDWCTAEAARYAVERWHYSRRMPMPPFVRVGAWERGKFIGCLIFARGANMNIGKPYGLAVTEVAELVRVALTSHESPVSRVMSIAVRFLRKHSPGLRLLISYADPNEGHHGGIYQACGWIYTGASADSLQFLHEGRWKHSREVTADSFGKSSRGSAKVDGWQSLPRRKVPGKHRYLLPLDEAMGAQVASLARPYPKRPTGDMGPAASEASGDALSAPPTERAVRHGPGRSKEGKSS